MKLMVIDGNSIVNRAFYGVPPLTTKDGRNTGAIYGFLNILSKLLEEQSPDGVCVAFDMKGPTFRHERFDGYKAQRKGMPDELAEQIPVLKSILDTMGIARFELQGYEADDLIGTISVKGTAADWDVVVVSGDKDDLQLLTDRVGVSLVITRGGKTTTTDYTPALFAENYGFEPIRLIDMKALMGDSSDNIPGVPGIGEKTAGDLLRRFGSLEAVYENLESPDIKPAARRKLAEGREMADLSFELATICLDVPMEFDPEETRRRPVDAPALRETFADLEFTRLMDKFGLAGAEEAAGVKTPELRHHEPQTAGEAEALLDMCRGADYVAVLPLEGLDGVEVCTGTDLYTVRWSNLGDGYAAFLCALFGSEVKKAGHNIKDLHRELLDEKIEAAGFIFDTALGAYLLSPTDSNYELTDLARTYLGIASEPAADVYALVPLLRRRLTELDMLRLLENMELPLCPVLAGMEFWGFLVDRGALHAFGQYLGEHIEKLQTTIYELAGEEFNINSPKQLGALLFDKLMLPAPKKTKTGYSTNIDVLESLRDKHEIIEPIITYRAHTKLKSTYTDGLEKCIRADGRIHTNFQMTVTATGRLSSVEPNLQNIPIRSRLGGEIRKMFVAPPGRVLVDADYSQIELRLLAHISGDETMQNAFRDGVDIHTVTASQVFDTPIDEVTTLQRSRAKAVNFGIVYGISDFSLAQDIGVTRAEAGDYIKNYFAKYHGVRTYMDNIIKQAKNDGYVATMFGRRRALPELSSSNYNVRSFGERVALNMPIQGAAADIMKIAMIRVAARLQKEALRARLVLQVHDELIVEAPENEAEQVKALLTEEMGAAAELSIPLVVEAHAGANWYDAK